MTRREANKDRTKQAPPRRRGSGLRHASDTARATVSAVAGQKGFAEADVILRWADIAGQKLSHVCRPVRIQYGQNRNLGAALVLECNSALAPEIEHQAPRIIERINQFYGYRAVSRVRIVQASPSAPARAGFAEGQADFAGQDLTQSAQISRAAEDLARNVEDEGLRAALTTMGAHILARSKTKEPGA
ncbi:MAG: DciA family protein [Pseudomonadota bacterium]